MKNEEEYGEKDGGKNQGSGGSKKWCGGSSDYFLNQGVKRAQIQRAELRQWLLMAVGFVYGFAVCLVWGELVNIQCVPIQKETVIPVEKYTQPTSAQPGYGNAFAP